MYLRNCSIGFTSTLRAKIGDGLPVDSRKVEFGQTVGASLDAYRTVVPKECSVTCLPECAYARRPRRECEAVVGRVHPTVAPRGPLRIRVLRYTAMFVLDFSHDSFEGGPGFGAVRKRRSLAQPPEHFCQSLASA